MPVDVQTDRSIAILLLSEPDTHNALSRSLVKALHAALDDEQVQKSRAIVIGSTDRYFSAGANINDLLDGWMLDADDTASPVKLFERLSTDPRPTIAAIDGGALGGGFELMLSCDLAIASSKAWFSLPELGHGVIPNTALMRLQRIVGVRRMMQCIMTGERIDSQLALDMGLVNALAADPVAQSVDMAASIVDRVAPGALAVAKAFAMKHANDDWQAVHQSLQQVPAPEWQEGLSAFTQKRPARYDAFWQEQAENRLKKNA
mgnify:CR=1 FL=1